jgi:hypothetical protein
MAVLGKKTSKLEHKAQVLVDNLEDRVVAFEKQKQNGASIIEITNLEGGG